MNHQKLKNRKEIDLPDIPLRMNMPEAKIAICDALLELLSVQSFESISVKEICIAAQVHRSTLYRYYSDKFEVLKESLQLVLATLEREISLFRTEPRDKICEQVFKFVARYHFLFEKILLTDDSSKLRPILQAILIENAPAVILKGKTNPEDPAREIIANYYSGAVLAVIEWWLRENMKPEAASMAEYLNMLFSSPAIG